MSIILNLFVSRYISLNFFKFFEIYNAIFYKNSRVVIPVTDIVARLCRVVALLYTNKIVSLYLPSSKANFNYLYKLDKQVAQLNSRNTPTFTFISASVLQTLAPLRY